MAHVYKQLSLFGEEEGLKPIAKGPSKDEVFNDYEGFLIPELKAAELKAAKAKANAERKALKIELSPSERMIVEKLGKGNTK